MTDYVKEQYELFIQDKITCEQFRERVWKFANFLSLTPEVWQFVPGKLVDGVWVVLEEPKGYKYWINDSEFGAYEGDDVEDCEQYQQAKERCYFVGCVLMDDWALQFPDGTLFCSIEELHKYTIEDLIDYNLTLTATAQKEIV